MSVVFWVVKWIVAMGVSTMVADRSPGPPSESSYGMHYTSIELMYRTGP
jgi:hypothetical protein